MNTSSQWRRSSRFGRRVEDAAWVAFSWMLTVTFLLLAITALPVVWLTVSILHAWEPLWNRVKDWIFVMQFTLSRMLCYSVETLAKFIRRL